MNEGGVCSSHFSVCSYQYTHVGSGFRYFSRMKTGWIVIIGHVAFWMLTASLIVSGFSIQAQEVELVDGVETVKIIRSESLVIKLSLAILLSALMFYLNLWNISRLSRRTGRLVVSATALGLLIGCFVTYFILESIGMPGQMLPLPRGLLVGVISFYFAISLAYGLARVWVASERRSQALALAKKQSELTMLRNQLQPHFLFNALNNLLSLVDRHQSPLLADSIEKLSSLLRYVVNEGASTVTVNQELSFIRNYAALQLLRFEKDEVDLQIRVHGEFGGQKIEPGLFIPFVENAFKYGAEPENHSAIRIDIDVREASRVLFEIENPLFPALRSQNGIGTGIDSVRARLRLIYPERHTLKILQNDTFRVSLELITE